MSANVQIVALFIVLALAAVAIRVVVGPVAAAADGGSLYAMSKVGPTTGPLADTVELAVSATQ